MGKFSTYGTKINEIAKTAFGEYQNASTRYETAQLQKKTYPIANGMIDAEYAKKAYEAEGEYIEAKAAYEKTRKNLHESSRDAYSVLRREFETAVRNEFSAQPSKMDLSTIELLKSGILNPGEYRKLIEGAEKEDNETMSRIIRQYAANAAETTKNENEARELRALVLEKSISKVAQYMENFDYCVTIFNKCMKNPAIMGHWGEFVESKLDTLF